MNIGNFGRFAQSTKPPRDKLPGKSTEFVLFNRAGKPVAVGTKTALLQHVLYDDKKSTPIRPKSEV